MATYIFLSVLCLILTTLIFIKIRNLFFVDGRFKYFTYLLLSGNIWVTFAMLEVVSRELTTKVFFSQLSYIGVLAAPVFLFLFSFEYAGKEKLEKVLKWKWYIWAFPIVTLVVVLTNQHHGLYWPSTEVLKEVDNQVIVFYARGLLYYAVVVYGYLLVAAAIFNIFAEMIKRHSLQKFAIVIIGVLTPLVTNLLYTLRFVDYDYTPAGFAFLFVCIGWAIINGFLEEQILVSQKIHEYIEEGIIVLDENRNVFSLNPSARKILNVRSLSKATITSKHPVLWQQIMAHIEQSKEGSFEYEISNRAVQQWYNVKVYAIKDPSIFDGWLISMFNISDKKLYERDIITAKEQAEAANVAKSHFLANMSHEIRTPLNGINGFIGLLQFTELTEEQGEYVKIINQSSETLMEIINDILDISKIESGYMQLEEAPFRLDATITAAVNLFEPKAREKGLELSLASLPGIPDFVMGDAVRLKQVIMNLINNAVKFTERGTIVAKASIEDLTPDQIEFRMDITDTGIGIPEEAIDKIFRTFTQADSTTTRKYGGTGLGLTICKHIIEMMGGTISVKSTVGVGTTFSFTVIFKKA